MSISSKPVVTFSCASYFKRKLIQSKKAVIKNDINSQKFAVNGGI